MLSGATFRASAIAGAAVFKIVVSSDSMKKATATSQGKSRLLDVSIVVAGSEFLMAATTVCRKYTESVDEAYVRNRSARFAIAITGAAADTRWVDRHRREAAGCGNNHV
jgi:hypothetical protein